MKVYSMVDVLMGTIHRPVVICTDHPDLTQQNFKDEVDIKNIVNKARRGILVDYVNENSPRYGDIDPVDFQEAMNIVADGNSMFEAMPAEQRMAFDNDPRKFFQAVHDPSQKDKLMELGLLKPEPKGEPAKPEAPQGSAAGAPPGAGAAGGGV